MTRMQKRAAAGRGARRVGRALSRAVEGAARLLALAAGALLLALAAMTVVSILGRAFGPGPVRGDYELVANGVGIAVFWMLPWCHLRRGHVTVDVAAARLPVRLYRALGLLGDAALTLAAAVILRQLWLAFGEKTPLGSEALRGALGFGPPPFFAETTFELQIPLWWLYGAALVGAAVMVVAGALATARSAAALRAGRPA